MRLPQAIALGSLLTAYGASFAADRPGRILTPGVEWMGRIQHAAIRESSGIIASRKFPGVFWTHNDRGNRRQALFAIRRHGEFVAEFLVLGAALADWEDLATDSEGNLFIGDIGNNDSKRRELAVHQLAEPDPGLRQRTVLISRSWRLTFPRAPFDCEGLFILGTNGYVVSKVTDDARAEIYRFSLEANPGPQRLELVAQTRIDSPVTGADVSADGELLGLVAKAGAFVYRINGDPAKAGDSKPHQTKFRHEHIEACAFVPEGLLTTAESREIYLFTDPAFRHGP